MPEARDVRLPLRRLLFWTHLVVGVIGAAVIVVMSFTGVLLTYERQLIEWSDRGFRVEAPASGGAERAPLDRVVESALAADADEAATVRTVTVASDPGRPIAVRLSSGTHYIDPYTGAVLGAPGGWMRDLMSDLRSWHRWLAMSGEDRATGKAITGAVNLGFLFLVLSGIYLWFPRRLTWRHFKSVLAFDRGAKGKVRDFNWHNVFGFWSALPLAVVVASATVISYPWASNLVYRLAGEAPPVRSAAAPAEEPAGPAFDPARLDGLFGTAAERLDGWRTIRITWPEPGAPVDFRIDLGTGRQPHKQHTLSLDAQSGEVAAWVPHEAQTAGRRARLFLRFAHTGEVWGIPGQTIAGLVSLFSLILAWTGVALAFRRGMRWLRRRGARPTQPIGPTTVPTEAGGAPNPTPSRPRSRPTRRRREREPEEVAL